MYVHRFNDGCALIVVPNDGEKLVRASSLVVEYGAIVESSVGSERGQVIRLSGAFDALLDALEAI